MAEVEVTGIIYGFNDAQRLFDLLDANADNVHEENHTPILKLTGSDIVDVHFSGMVFQFLNRLELMNMLDERADLVREA